MKDPANKNLLSTKKTFKKGKGENLRDPALTGLHRKESEHRVEAVVVVEVLPGPPAQPGLERKVVKFEKLFAIKEIQRDLRRKGR